MHRFLVIIEKAGEIIPQVVSVDADRRPRGARRFVLPRHCPICRTSTVREEGEVASRCPNDACPAKRREAIDEARAGDIVAVVGLPHGAAHHRFARPRLEPLLGPAWWGVFLAGYLAIAGAVVLGWFLVPAATILVFFLASAWHFGQEESRLPIGPRILRPAFLFARGGLVIWTPLVFQCCEVGEFLGLVAPGGSGPAIQLATKDARELLKVHGLNTLVNLQVEGEATPRPVVVRHVQREAVSHAQMRARRASVSGYAAIGWPNTLRD
jgi:hypothetical protein